ncbi:hypothetical protein [Nitratidesulfovibrio sp. 1201_IL3209]|uniref:hypothetical protein n=1 Tax=Nitratidesulfovibrio sp. 1201_IL3209 TaxID=3084053 RepID=UPI002FD988A5
MEEQEYVDAYNDGYDYCYVKLKETEAERDALRERVEALEWLREVEQAGGAWLAKRYRKIGRKRYDSLVTQYRATHAHALEEAGYDLYE